ncbi:SLAM family member 9-like [Onychostoma macrolepis]|uniref:SLAM family member 9-like n=1 Tax=Onychostoma macrolepis TaxID=369639 RepID=UPI00272B2696|nr:SLAM family member 9-like [Onychostoma macrolepis]
MSLTVFFIKDKISSTQCKQVSFGVFGESVSVMEGDSVTLHTDVTETYEGANILWKFGAEKSMIAEISGVYGIFTSDVPDGRFRDRLKLDSKTGSLTITNITTEHAGLYEVQMSGITQPSNKYILKKINHTIAVYARLPMPNITRDFSQNLSSSSSSSSSSQQNCSLLCSVVNVRNVTLSWYKGNSLLSSISVSDLSISLSLPLEVEYQDKNTYSCVLNNPISNQTTHLDICELCWPCPGQKLPSFNIGLISAAAAGSLLIVAAVVMCCISKKCRQIDRKVQTCEEMITYAEPSFYKRKAQANVKEEDHVVYAPVTMRR